MAGGGRFRRRRRRVFLVYGASPSVHRHACVRACVCVCARVCGVCVAGHGSCAFHFVRELALLLAEHEDDACPNFHAFAKQFLPPSVLDVASRPLHATIMWDGDVLKRALPRADERSKFKPKVVDEIDKFNQRYLDRAMESVNKEWCVAFFRDLRVAHRSRDDVYDGEEYPHLHLLSHLSEVHIESAAAGTSSGGSGGGGGGDGSGARADHVSSPGSGGGGGEDGGGGHCDGVSGGGEYEHMYTDDDDALLASSDSDSHSSSIDDEDDADALMALAWGEREHDDGCSASDADDS